MCLIKLQIFIHFINHGLGAPIYAPTQDFHHFTNSPLSIATPHNAAHPHLIPTISSTPLPQQPLHTIQPLYTIPPSTSSLYPPPYISSTLLEEAETQKLRLMAVSHPL